MPSLALVQALANSRDYRQPAVAIAVWLAVIGAGAWLVPRLRTGGLDRGRDGGGGRGRGGRRGRDRRGAPRARHPGGADLAILGTAWLLVLVVLSHPARVWVPVALLVFAVQGAVLIGERGLDLLGLSQLAAGGYIIATVLIAFAALRPTVDMQVDLAARQASLASRSAAERAAAAAIKQERDSRLAVLEREALPLLRGIADGTLDPAARTSGSSAPGTRRCCGAALTERAPAPASWWPGLSRRCAAARERGLPVTVQVDRRPGDSRRRRSPARSWPRSRPCSARFRRVRPCSPSSRPAMTSSCT